MEKNDIFIFINNFNRFQSQIDILSIMYRFFNVLYLHNAIY